MNLTQAISKIKEELDLVTVMEAAGVEFTYHGSETCKAKCFLHPENNPSLTVSVNKGLYHCFSTGCAASGDVITFYQQKYGYTTIEAVRHLIEDYGLNISLDHDPKYELREKYRKVHEKLTEKLEKSPEALDYLAKRKISVETAKAYGLCYSPSVNYTVGLARRIGLSFDEIESLELNRPHIYENTVLFPIIEPNGCGYSMYAHSLIEKTGAKYIGNSNKHALKWKGSVFGLQVANRAPKNDGIIIVEGFFDVLQCYESGLDNVVALCGSNPTKEQMDHILSARSNYLYIMLDGDKAGHEGTELALKLDTESNIKIVTLPKGKDPDDVIKEEGIEVVTKCISEAISPLDYLIRKFADSIYNTNDTDIIIRSFKEVFRSINDYTAVNKMVALQRISELTSVPIDLLYSGMSSDEDVEDIIKVEEKVLSYYINHLEQLGYMSIVYKPSDFLGKFHGQIYAYIKKLSVNEVKNIDDVVSDDIADEEMAQKIKQLASFKSTLNIDYYTKKLNEIILRRGIIKNCKRTIAELSDGKVKAQDILNKHLVGVSTIANPDIKLEFSASEQIKSTMAYIYDRMASEDKFAGIDLGRGWSKLMSTIMGFQSPYIYLIAATAKVGKTALAQNFNLRMGLMGIPTLWFNFEMSERDMAIRNLSMMTGISNQRLKMGYIGDEERKKLEDAALKYYNAPMYTVNASGFTIEQVMNTARKYVYTKGIKAIFIDYLQLVAPSKQEYWESNAHISTQTKIMATQLKVPVIAISQLGREAEKNSSSSGMYIQGAYKFIQDCDVYMGMSINKDADSNGGLNNRIINIGYNRHGMNDVNIDVFFDGETLKCEEVD